MITDWLYTYGHAHFRRDLGDPAVADDLRQRARVGIAPVTPVDGRPVWGTEAEQVRRLCRLPAPHRRRWTLPGGRD